MDLRSILLIEDDRINSFAFKEGLVRINNAKESAEAALEYLHGEENPLPNMVVLDLNLPKTDGIEFLRIIKKNENFKSIPIVVFTVSLNPGYKIDCFNL